MPILRLVMALKFFSNPFPLNTFRNGARSELIKQNRETEDLTPKKVGTKKPSPLEAHKEIIVETVEQHPDWTLWQYCEEIVEKTGVSVSTGTMCRFLEKQELTLKKRRFAVKKLLLKKCNRKGLIIGKKSRI